MLSLNLKLDSVYYLTTNAELTILEDINGRQQVVTTILGGKAANKIIAIKDSLYEIEVLYKRMSMNLTVAGRTASYDSDDKNSSNPLSKVMAAMMDKPFTMTVSRSGKVIAVKNMERVYADAFKGPSQITEAQQAQLKKQVEKSFGAAAVKKNFQDAFAMLPTIAVGLNDKWAASTTSESVVAINEKISYTLKDITDKAFLINGESVITSAGTSDFKLYNGVTMRYSKVNGSTTSQLMIDKNTGWIIEAKIAKLIKCTVEVKQNAPASETMTFPMTITGNLTMSSR